MSKRVWNRYNWKGQEMTLHEIAKNEYVDKCSLKRHLGKGQTLAQAIDELHRTDNATERLMETYEFNKSKCLIGMIFTAPDPIGENPVGTAEVFGEFKLIQMFKHFGLCENIETGTRFGFRYDDIIKGYPPYHNGKAIYYDYDEEYKEDKRRSEEW